jgi:hypothetical protein
MPPQKGGLTISCEPASGPSPEYLGPFVCQITIKGENNFIKTVEVTKGPMVVDGLTTGRYEVVAVARPYIAKNETAYVTAPEVRALPFKLELDSWGSLTDLQAFDAVLSSLGGKSILNAGKLSKNSARMRMVGDPPSIGMWNAHVDELVAPNRLRWELNIAGSNWKVNYDGTRVRSDGDKKKYGGTEFAQQLEQSILLFSAMRLPLVLSLILEKFDIKKGPPLVLIADSRDAPTSERYTFQLNADFSPQKVIHERLTAPRSREEIEFAQYKSIGQDLKLPHVLILRYPDRSKHEHIFEYEKIDINARIVEEQFKP